MRLGLRCPGLPQAGRLAAVIAGAVVVAAVARAEDPDPAVARGRAFAAQNCGSCHAIGPSGESPLAKAPPFRTLHERYPVENLTEALAEGIRTGHPEMPQFDELDTEQIDDLIAYLKSLEMQRPAAPIIPETAAPLPRGAAPGTR